MFPMLSSVPFCPQGIWPDHTYKGNGQSWLICQLLHVNSCPFLFIIWITVKLEDLANHVKIVASVFSLKALWLVSRASHMPRKGHLAQHRLSKLLGRSQEAELFPVGGKQFYSFPVNRRSVRRLSPFKKECAVSERWHAVRILSELLQHSCLYCPLKMYKCCTVLFYLPPDTWIRSA